MKKVFAALMICMCSGVYSIDGFESVEQFIGKQVLAPVRRGYQLCRFAFPTLFVSKEDEAKKEERLALLKKCEKMFQYGEKMLFGVFLTAIGSEIALQSHSFDQNSILKLTSKDLQRAFVVGGMIGCSYQYLKDRILR